MHILCTICSDLVNQAESIYVTKCGHIFHHNCLAQWIERSKSCPQCRNKVTDRCMYRIYPTISNEIAGDDVATLQSRLDDAQLQLRQQQTADKEKDDKLATITANLKKTEELLKACEKKLVSRESAVSALKEQLDYVKIQNKETQRLKEENEVLHKNIQTLQGLQKVLNATSEEVEQMLQGYTDVRTVATFTTALKRALCESEAKRREGRDRLQAANNHLATERSLALELRANIAVLEERVRSAEQTGVQCHKRCSTNLDNADHHTKRHCVETPPPHPHPHPRLNDAIRGDTDISFGSSLCAESADSPYLRLQRGGLPLAAAALARADASTLPPSEFAILHSAKAVAAKRRGENKPPAPPQPHSTSSIFHSKSSPPLLLSSVPRPKRPAPPLDVSYDGLGGHSKLETFPLADRDRRPAPKSCLPKLTAKHKLKRPTLATGSGSQDISKMLHRIRDN